MFQYRFLTIRSHRPAKDRCILLDNACERDDEDHPSLAMRNGMVERKGQRGQRLAAPGWDVQGKHPRGKRSLCPCVLKNPRPKQVDFTITRETAEVPIELCAQHIQSWHGALAAGCLPNLRQLELIVVAFGIDVVGIHQRGEKHPDQKGLTEGWARRVHRQLSDKRPECLCIGKQGHDFLLPCPIQGW